jgi:hypothetical protein
VLQLLREIFYQQRGLLAEHFSTATLTHVDEYLNGLIATRSREAVHDREQESDGIISALFDK